jgi:hypothetical protein
MPTRGKWGWVVAAVLLGTAAPAAAATTATDLFYERALMVAANAACRLFSAPEAATLTAAEAQARGAALRSGASVASLQAIQMRAHDTALAAGCGSPDIATAAGRVRDAFAGYAQLQSMRYPGEQADWLAERAADDGLAHWRLSQRVRFDWNVMVFGIVGHGVGRPLMAVASFPDGATPYGARLILRDTAVTTSPYLETREADIEGRLPLDARLPPRTASRVFTAAAMSPAGRDLAGTGMAGAWAFRFPIEAEAALATLDPREAVAVEFLFAGDDGETVRTAYVEVGDFAAGQAFESLAQR